MERSLGGGGEVEVECTVMAERKGRINNNKPKNVGNNKRKMCSGADAAAASGWMDGGL